MPKNHETRSQVKAAPTHGDGQKQPDDHDAARGAAHMSASSPAVSGETADPQRAIPGPSGILALHTPWGKLPYPCPPIEDWKGTPHAEAMDFNTKTLVHSMGEAERMAVDVKRRAQPTFDKSWDLGASADKDWNDASTSDVAGRLDPNVADQAQKISDTAMQEGVLSVLIENARMALKNGWTRLHAASQRRVVVSDKRLAREISAQIDRVNKCMGLVDKLTGTAIGMAFNPEEAIGAAVECIASLAIDAATEELTSDLEEERDSLEEDALDKEKEAALDDWQVARNEMDNAESNVSTLNELISKNASQLDRRRRGAERAYDRHAPRGAVKLGDLRAATDEADQDAKAADEAREQGQQAMFFRSKVQQYLEVVTGFYHAQHRSYPELSDGFLALGNMANHTTQQEQELKEIAGTHRMQATIMRKQLFEIDAKLADAAETYSAEGKGDPGR